MHARLTSASAKVKNQLHTLVRRAFRIQISRIRATPPPPGVSLNVGVGKAPIEGWIGLDVESDWYGPSRDFIRYDLRRDRLPFENESVDRIYASHVIEHVEDHHVQQFFAEASRVLKRGGVLRLCTPDAEFLAHVSSFQNDYWLWFPQESLDQVGVDASSRCRLKQSDYLQIEIGRANFHAKSEQTWAVGSEVLFDAEAMERVLDAMTSGLHFDASRINWHISWWSFDKVRRTASPFFRYVVRSKYQGSIDPFMRGFAFDKVHPVMSLYVDLVK